MDHESKIIKINSKSTEDERFIKGREIHKKYIINKLNYINFQDGTIIVNLRHAKAFVPYRAGEPSGSHPWCRRCSSAGPINSKTFSFPTAKTHCY